MPISANGPGFLAAAIREIPRVFNKRAVAKPIPEFPPIINMVFDMADGGSRTVLVKGESLQIDGFRLSGPSCLGPTFTWFTLNEPSPTCF